MWIFFSFILSRFPVRESTSPYWSLYYLFSHHCDQRPDRSNFKGGLILAHSFRVKVKWLGIWGSPIFRVCLHSNQNTEHLARSSSSVPSRSTSSNAFLQLDLPLQDPATFQSSSRYSDRWACGQHFTFQPQGSARPHYFFLEYLRMLFLYSIIILDA